MDFAQALSIAKDNRGSDETTYREALEYLIDHRDELKSRVFVLIPGGMTSNTDPTWNKVRENTNSRCGCGNERTLMPLNVREKYEPGETVTMVHKDKIHIRPKGSDKESCVVMLEVVCFEEWAEEARQATAARPAASDEGVAEQAAAEQAEAPAPEPEAPEPEVLPVEPQAAEAPAAEPVVDSAAEAQAPEAPDPAETPKTRTFGLRMVKDPFGPFGLDKFLEAFSPTAVRLDKFAEMEASARTLLFVQDNRKTPLCNVAEVDPTKPEVVVVLDADMEVFDPSLEPDRHFVQMAVMTIGGPDPESQPEAEAQAADSAATPVQTE